MEKKDLRKSPVKFASGPHTYTMPDGRMLQGVTRMIEELLFPGDYAGVDPAVLSAKAAYGKAMHEEVQDMVVFGEDPATDAQRAFASLMEQGGLTPVASEYTVSDEADFASNIDIVCVGGELVDIKTTYALNRRKVSWQLSIYAYLFEMQNPGLKAGRLYAAWLPKQGEPKLAEVPRIGDAEVKRLMECWLAGEEYERPATKLDLGLVGRLIEAKAQAAAADAEVKRLSAELMAQMQERGELQYKDECATISLKAATTATTFDSKALKEADPDTYGKYLTTSQRAASLSVRLAG